MNKNIFFILFFLQNIWANPTFPEINSFNLNDNARQVTHLIGIMVEFQREELEDDPQTSGDGHFLQEIDVNLIGSYRIARECAQLGINTMIFIASVAGKYGKPEHSGYSASKGATISLVQSLAFEGYDAYAISPGRVDTKMREMDYPGEDPRTRLTTHSTASVIFDCINGRYEPGDNIIYRKRGFRTLRRVDKGQPWKKYLNVQPYGTPKEI